MSRKLTILVGLTILCAAPLEPVDGAELRTTAGKRAVYRTVAYDEASLGGPPLAVPSPMMMEPEPLMFDDACIDCGTVGCQRGCVRSCGRWADVEYLLWWRNGRRVPPLVTTSPDGTQLNQAGVLGFNNTTILFGDDTFGDDARPGGRLTIGTWLDPYQCNSVEGRFFTLGNVTANYDVTSNGSPILARPFNNRDAGLGPVGQTSRPLAFPGIAVNGSVSIRSESEVLGGDVLYRRRVCDTGSTRWDLLAGYHWSRIEEDLRISDSFVDADPGNIIADGTRQDITDLFETRNEFHGGQIGIEAKYFGPCWNLELLAKVAFGNMSQVVNVVGQTVNDVPNDPNSPFVLNEGLLANNSNQGRRSRDEFAVVPEIGATMSYQLTECFDLSFGYSFIYWSNVVQPGDQIDQALFIPSQSTTFNDGSYWVHGLNVGAEWRF